jgi:RimJ/RimL family protein N-acetyltransferase
MADLAIGHIQLIECQIEALFTSDAGQRLHCIREPGYPESELDPAPRFFMGRTVQGNVWRFRHDLPAPQVRALAALCAAEPITARLADPPQHAAAIRAVLNAHTPIQNEERGPAYWAPVDSPERESVVLISDTNAHVLRPHFSWALMPQSDFKTRPIVAAIVDNAAVAICHCARFTARAAEAGVETVAVYRGHGHASAAVAGWVSVIRQRGLIPLYSTAWENRASQGVARKLGMILYGDDWSVT